MTIQRSDKKKYKHISTGDYCTCNAYVAEVMCMKYAEFKNKGSLPFKFWNTKTWKWTYTKQLIKAGVLIKQYSETSVVKAINSSEFARKRIFSLNNKQVDRIITHYYKLEKIAAEKAPTEIVPIIDKPQIRKSTYGKKTGLHKLRSKEKNGKEKSVE